MGNPMTWTWVQWVNFVSFVIFSLAGASWWTAMVSPEAVASVVGGLGWLASILNFMVTGKVPDPKIVEPTP